MVTKQEQLEWLAKNWTDWPRYMYANVVAMSAEHIGKIVAFALESRRVITKKEWQQERDKMQKQQQTIGDEVYSALQENAKKDNSWHERGELPPVGCECLSPGGETIMIASHGSISNVPVAFYPFGVSGLYSAACAKQFRPLRTEREKAIDEMATLAMDCKKYDITQNVAKAVCELLYDAGYRKQ